MEHYISLSFVKPALLNNIHLMVCVDYFLYFQSI